MTIDNHEINDASFQNPKSLFQDMCKYGITIVSFYPHEVRKNVMVLNLSIPHKYDTGFFNCHNKITNNALFFTMDLARIIQRELDIATTKTGKKVILAYTANLKKFWSENDFYTINNEGKELTDADKDFIKFMKEITG